MKSRKRKIHLLFAEQLKGELIPKADLLEVFQRKEQSHVEHEGPYAVTQFEIRS